MLRPPNDIVELPHIPWPKRPYGVELTTWECISALWKAEGNVSKAAELLRIDPGRMRRIVHRFPEIKEHWLEIREQMLDRAEGNVREALDAPEPARKDVMARFVLDRSGREYACSRHLEHVAELGTVRIVWNDGERTSE